MRGGGDKEREEIQEKVLGQAGEEKEGEGGGGGGELGGAEGGEECAREGRLELTAPQEKDERQARQEDEADESSIADDDEIVGPPSSTPTTHDAPAATAQHVASPLHPPDPAPIANYRETQSLGDMGRMARPPSPPRLGSPSPSSSLNKTPFRASSPSSFSSSPSSHGNNHASASAAQSPPQQASAPATRSAARSTGHRGGGAYRTSNKSSANSSINSSNSSSNNNVSSVRPIDYWKAKKSPYGSAPPSNIPGVRPSKGTSSGYRPRPAPRKVS